LTPVGHVTAPRSALFGPALFVFFAQHSAHTRSTNTWFTMVAHTRRKCVRHDTVASVPRQPVRHDRRDIYASFTFALSHIFSHVTSLFQMRPLPVLLHTPPCFTQTFHLPAILPPPHTHPRPRANSRPHYTQPASVPLCMRDPVFLRSFCVRASLGFSKRRWTEADNQVLLFQRVVL
jgi:hypothetical protein